MVIDPRDRTRAFLHLRQNHQLLFGNILSSSILYVTTNVILIFSKYKDRHLPFLITLSMHSLHVSFFLQIKLQREDRVEAWRQEATILDHRSFFSMQFSLLLPRVSLGLQYRSIRIISRTVAMHD